MHSFDLASFPSSLQISDAAQMQALGRVIGEILQAGDVVQLSGELGAGKTTLTQGIAQGMELEDVITSPTFVLMTEYPDGRLPLLHMDAYRLDDSTFDDLREAGVDDFFARVDAVRVVEWPQYIHKYLQLLPPPNWDIRIEHDAEARIVTIERNEKL